MSSNAAADDPLPQSATKHYKVRLASGRVLGPLDIERIKLFIIKNKISGGEVARLYPSGTWKDINQFPEIAELILQHLEGRLNADVQAAEAGAELEEPGGDEPPAEEPAEPQVRTASRGTRKIEAEEESAPAASRDEEGTMVISRDNEGTMVFSPGEESLPELADSADARAVAAEEDPLANSELDLSRPSGPEAREKTVMLSLPPKGGAAGKKTLIPKKILIPLVALVATFAVLDMVSTPPQKPAPSAANIPFRIEFPAHDAKAKGDPQASEITYKSALSFYNLDTVDGYKRATGIFARAVTQDAGNIKAIALLASSYINLTDVVDRDERFFQVVTGLIESARAKQVDMAELIVAEVELYNMVLSNPDAAINRLIEYSKVQLSGSQQFPMELFLYLAQSYYTKGKLADAVKNLDLIPVDKWFSVKIPYLYGLIFEKNGQYDMAVEAFEKVIQKSPNHVKARVHLAEVHLRKSNLPSAGTQADFVIKNAGLASTGELSKAHYIRGKMLGSVNRNAEALADLDRARRLDPENTDVLFEYYTVRARVSQSAPDAKKRVKIYDLLASGEAALKKGDLQVAMRLFLEARKEDAMSAQPLLRISEIFKRQGQYYNAMKNHKKALELEPAREDIYPGFVTLAVDSYEFESAKKAIEKYTALNPQPPAHTIDFLYGYWNYKNEQLREAAVYFKRAMKSASVDIRLYVNYADILFRTGAYKEAAFYYGLARRFDPFNVSAVTGVALSLTETDGLAKAVLFLKDEMERVEAKAPFHAILAQVYLRKNDTVQALISANKALELDPQYPMAHKVKGDALQSQEKYKEAEESYESYSALNVTDPRPFIDRYRMAMRRQDYVTARKLVNHIINMYPRYPGGHYMLGDIALLLKEPDEARREAELELKNNPGFVPGLVLAGNAWNMRRDYLKGLEYLNKALALDPNFVPALIGAGYSNHMLKTYAAAQTLLERAAKIDAGDPMVRKRLGSLYIEMGQRERALQELKTYLDLYPDAPDRVEIERLIQ